VNSKRIIVNVNAASTEAAIRYANDRQIFPIDVYAHASPEQGYLIVASEMDMGKISQWFSESKYTDKTQGSVYSYVESS
jgi:hypothetical protein